MLDRDCFQSALHPVSVTHRGNVGDAAAGPMGNHPRKADRERVLGLQWEPLRRTYRPLWQPVYASTPSNLGSSTRIVRELLDRVSMNTQVLCSDFVANVGLKKQGATVLVRNPLLFQVAGAGFEPATFGL